VRRPATNDAERTSDDYIRRGDCLGQPPRFIPAVREALRLVDRDGTDDVALRVTFNVAWVILLTVSVVVGTLFAIRPLVTEHVPDEPVTHDAVPPVLHVAVTVAFATGPSVFAIAIVTVAFQPLLPVLDDDGVRPLTCIVVSPCEGGFNVVADAVFE
jgi:hypothetical protein